MDFAAGLGVMAVSLWLLFDQQLYLQNLGADQTDYYIGTYIILGIGAVMTLIGNALFNFITLAFVPSDMVLCKAFFTCSTGRWADIVATVQPNW